MLSQLISSVSFVVKLINAIFIFILNNIVILILLAIIFFILYKAYGGKIKLKLENFRARMLPKRNQQGKILVWDALQELVNYLEEKLEGFDKKEYIKRAEARTKANQEKALNRGQRNENTR